MANEQANKDDNNVSTLLGVLKTDGISTVRIKGANGGIKASFLGGANTVSTVAQKDDNEVSSLVVVSSVDGTSMAVAADSSGNILLEIV